MGYAYNPSHEVDLLRHYPKGNRPERIATPEDQYVARQFGKAFFDGERRYGYGGYNYDPKYWAGVVRDFVEWYGSVKSILDVGCAKGFMLYEFKQALPAVKIYGVDVSDYAITHAHPEVRDCIEHADARWLPFPNKAVELAISINTIHNLDRKGVIQALRELQRVSQDAFISVDAYKTQAEREAMLQWNLTAQTILQVEEWRGLFKYVGYTGDYTFWNPLWR